MNTNPNQSFDNLSIEELIDLLIEKTSQLMQEHENGIDGLEFRNLLLQVEQLNHAIKIKRQSSQV
jgi:hypothetical protein